MIRREFLRRGALWVAAGAITPAALDRLDWAAHRIHALGPLYRARVVLSGYAASWSGGTWQEEHIVPVDVRNGVVAVGDMCFRWREPRSLERVTVVLPAVPGYEAYIPANFLAAPQLHVARGAELRIVGVPFFTIGA